MKLKASHVDVESRRRAGGGMRALTLATLFAATSGYLVMLNIGTSPSLPAGIDIAKISLAPLPIFFGAAYLIVGFLMFAGFMTATAAAAPSSKEANSFSSIFFLSAFIPFYFIMPIVTDPEGPVVQILTYFPLTAPVVTLIRNTVGNMSELESWLALGVMTVFMVASIWIAIRAFRLGALEFGSTIKLSKLFKKQS